MATTVSSRTLSTDIGELILLSHVSKEEKEKLLNQYPGLSEKIFLPESDQDAKKTYKVNLGEGTFSKVSLGRINNHYYAIRKIKSQAGLPVSLPRNAVLKMTQKEILLQNHIKQLKISDHILPLVHHLETKNKKNEIQHYQIFPIADLGNGREVIKKIKESTLDNKEKAILFKYIAITLLKSVAEINHNDFFIRDIKPENILFTSKGDVWLADLGSSVCYVAPNNMIEASNLSDKAYLPPTLLFELSHPTHPHISAMERNKQMDAWALGLTLLQFYPNNALKNLVSGILNDSARFEKIFQHKSLSEVVAEYKNNIAFIKQAFLVNAHGDPFFKILKGIIFDLLDSTLSKSQTVKNVLDKYQLALTLSDKEMDLIQNFFNKVTMAGKETPISNKIKRFGFINNLGYVNTFTPSKLAEKIDKPIDSFRCFSL